jgi:hypothetical protein
VFRDQISIYRDQTVWSLMLSTVLVSWCRWIAGGGGDHGGFAWRQTRGARQAEQSMAGGGEHASCLPLSPSPSPSPSPSLPAQGRLVCRILAGAAGQASTLMRKLSSVPPLHNHLHVCHLDGPRGQCGIGVPSGEA